MAKCSVCHLQKGKRKCLLVINNICSLCCGTTRKKETCGKCVYYQEPNLTRRYKDVPAYTTLMMDDNSDLQSYANVIESALCAFDQSTGNEIKDEVAIKIIELLIDKYHFKDITKKHNDKIIAEGFSQVDEAIRMDLSDIPYETITKILGVIYFVARRRSKGRREYIDIIQRYVGIRIGQGMRRRPLIQYSRPF